MHTTTPTAEVRSLVANRWTLSYRRRISKRQRLGAGSSNGKDRFESQGGGHLEATAPYRRGGRGHSTSAFTQCSYYAYVGRKVCTIRDAKGVLLRRVLACIPLHGMCA
jgi:hypothetical protein